MDIKNIEQKIAELKFRERDLVKEINRHRGRYLYNAEKSWTVNSILDRFFVDTLGISKNRINRYSQFGNCSGRDSREFVDDVIVSLYTDKLEDSTNCRDCSEITVKVRINANFEDGAIRAMETETMDEILKIHNEINALQRMKKNLKQNDR